MIRSMYPNACPSHLKNGTTSSSWGVKTKQLELYHLPTFLLKLDEEFRSPSKKPEQDYDTFITTTNITKV